MGVTLSSEDMSLETALRLYDLSESQLFKCVSLLGA